MDKYSTQKVIKSGFKIIRTDDSPNIRIKIRDSVNKDWRTLEKFETKAARNRRFNELLTHDDIISD